MFTHLVCELTVVIPDTVIVSIGGICTLRVNFTSPVTLSKTSLFLGGLSLHLNHLIA